ncbi:hypothetical protein PGTUg99_020578 [Puccinia graminis f. sp. tritici]|uniref:Uncharacterized protein n=1 Tax=Puccinia graminis f. sp. tritici TaxID=56615 RepID=A0A5B0RVS2_PUCGR|nr:hypothetical protein PGTUg99_020578 [Puccinia graminis f. sp. tritici]
MAVTWQVGRLEGQPLSESIISLWYFIVQVLDQSHFDLSCIVATKDIRDKFGFDSHTDLNGIQCAPDDPAKDLTVPQPTNGASLGSRCGRAGLDLCTKGVLRKLDKLGQDVLVKGL